MYSPFSPARFLAALPNVIHYGNKHALQNTMVKAGKYISVESNAKIRELAEFSSGKTTTIRCLG